jgi:uncharacterized RDD family membrane protein YckC
MDWYYVSDGERRGPFTRDLFQDLVRGGTISADTLVWNADMADWQPFAHIAPAFLSEGSEPVVSTIFCVNCRQARQPSEVIAFGNAPVCGYCKDAFFQRMSQGASRPLDRPYAGFWIRLGAKILDMLLLASVVYVVYATMLYILFLFLEPDPMYVFALSFSLNGIQFLLGLAYGTWFVGRFQSTPGKMVCGLRIVMPEGERISYARALGRVAAEHISWIIFGIGYLMAIWDDERRTVHDHICNTRVVRE